MDLITKVIEEHFHGNYKKMRELIKTNCPGYFLEYYPIADANSYVKGKGCRGISCAECWTRMYDEDEFRGDNHEDNIYL